MVIVEADVDDWFDFDEGTGTALTNKAGGTDGSLVGTPTWIGGRGVNF